MTRDLSVDVNPGCNAMYALHVSIFSLSHQFGPDWTVYLTKPDGSYKETSLSELLPLAFSPAHLAKN